MSQFPHELIRQVQISTRSAAGLSGYDPHDPTLPALPSLTATIATLEPSPPYLRCKHCKGRLLRGLQSIICVYCGRRHENDVAPDPISFNSTIGYQWLLRSLSLDGSEMVKPLTNKKQDQGQSSPKAESPLSDFLNFKIAWPAEIETQDSIVSDKHSEENKRSLSLTGVALDNFFFKSKRDGNQVGTTGTKEVASLDSQYLFQNVQSSEPAGSSSIDKTTESFSEWEADFQTAVSDNQHGVSKSSDHFTGSSADSGNKFQESKSLDRFTSLEVDLSAHMDSMFGPRKDQNDGKPLDNPVASPTFSDLNSEDLWNNMSSNESQLVAGFDAPVRAKDDHALEKSNNLSTSADLFQTFQWQTNNTDMLENKTMNGEHNTVHESWHVGGTDATVSAKDDHTPEISNNLSTSADLFQDFQWQTNETDITGNKTLNEEHITMNESQLAGGFDATVSAKDDHTSENSNNISTSVDLFQNFQGQTNTTDMLENKTMNGEHSTVNESLLVGGFDATVSAKDDHMSEISNNPSTSDDLFQDFQWQTNETDITGNKTVNKEHITMNESQFVGGFEATVSAKDDHTLEISNNLSTGVDLFQDFQWQTNVTDITGNKTVTEVHITLNESQLVGGFDVTVSTKDDHTLKNSNNPSTSDDLFQNFQWQTNETDITENKTMNEEHNTMNEDSFDEWNDFTGSTTSQDPSQNSWIQSDFLFISPKKSSDIDLFSSNSKFEERDFGGFSQPNLLSSSTGNNNSPTEVNAILSETASNRLSDASSPSYESGQAAYNAHDFGKSTKPEDDVKMLISQMHDLSFMLKSDLCIPSTSDSHNSSTKY